MIVPNKTFKFRVGPDWDDKSTDDLFKGKRVVVVSLPGAFTPICSSKQLPKYEDMYDQFKEAGIDAVYCVSVNDAFVMNAWAKDLGVEKVEMVPDGDGVFTRGMNMLVDKPAQGFGLRSWRYAMVVNNKKVEKMFVEEGLNNLGLDDDPYTESTPEAVLEYLKNNQ
jgi:peroxiredoxin